MKALSYRLGFHTQLSFLLTTLIHFILEGKTAPLGIALLLFIYENSTGCFCRQPISLYKEKANRFAMLASHLACNCVSYYKIPVHFCKMSTLSPNQKQFLFQLGFRIIKSIQHKSTELLNGLRQPRQLICLFSPKANFPRIHWPVKANCWFVAPTDAGPLTSCQVPCI